MTEIHRKFVNARSPLRLLEKGLQGGLGAGNLGVLVAGRGLGKTPFLAGDRVTGVSIMRVEREMDAGPVAMTRQIAGRPTWFSVTILAIVAQSAS